jgi:hypothetical protein
MQIVKYTLYYYITLGWLPVMFDKLNMNSSSSRKISIKKRRRPNPLTVMFTDIEHKEQDNNNFKRSVIISNIQPITSFTSIDFLLPNKTNIDKNTGLENNNNSLLSEV